MFTFIAYTTIRAYVAQAAFTAISDRVFVNPHAILAAFAFNAIYF